MTYRKHKPRKPKKVWENVFDEKLQKYVVRRLKPTVSLKFRAVTVLTEGEI
jgi:hypothetical protein